MSRARKETKACFHQRRLMQVVLIPRAPGSSQKSATSATEKEGDKQECKAHNSYFFLLKFTYFVTIQTPYIKLASCRGRQCYF
jgi:hypothetical protein